jgi:FkbM family methyltransferase
VLLIREVSNKDGEMGSIDYKVAIFISIKKYKKKQMINKFLYAFQFIKNVIDNLISSEFDEIKTIRKYLKGKIIFFDIGYNLGFETNKIRKIFNSGLEIHAFEPNPNLNIYVPNDVKFNNVAVTYKKFTKKQKFVSKKISSASGLKNFVNKIDPSDKIVLVKTMRLDTYFKKNKIKKIDFMKIDAELCDLDCLKSLGKYMGKLKLLKIECTAPTYYKIFNYLNSKSFIFLGINNNKYVNNEFSCGDAFFLNSKYKNL